MNDDLIRRGELAEEVKSLTVYVNGLRAGKGVLQEYAKQYRDSLLRIIDEQPAVDAVEVVRCKDCRMAAMLRKQKGEVIADCMLRRFHTDDEDFIEVCGDDFCSYGVRREDDG